MGNASIEGKEKYAFSDKMLLGDASAMDIRQFCPADLMVHNTHVMALPYTWRIKHFINYGNYSMTKEIQRTNTEFSGLEN